MQLPTIHPNGTPKAMLVEALVEASQAIELAFQALKRTAPNGRDYQPGHLAMAELEHRERMRRLDDVKKEVDALTVAIDGIGE